MAFNCSKCGKENKNGTGLSAHERRCSAGAVAEPVVAAAVAEPVVAAAEPVRAEKPAVSALQIVRQLKGLTLTFDGKYHLEDPSGRVIGHYDDEGMAIKGIEGMARHAKNFR